MKNSNKDLAQTKNQKYLPIIGLEIHVELKTASKMFCSCSAEHFLVEPNTHTCPVCLGLPGALPVPNQKAIEWCQLIALALDCQLNQESKFDRKNYFYPDLPKGYQISQYDQPLGYQGRLKLTSENEKPKIIRINRVHMEEDTAKLIHTKIKNQTVSLIDFNRSGVPLVEIVTEPDFRSIQEVDEFLKKIRQLIRYLQVSDCDMEKGSMRLEVNMSLSPFEQKSKKIKLPNYKVEIKNINSFRFVRKAIEYEYQRQQDLLSQGKSPRQETRGWNEAQNKTVSQRTKEEADDYRYFPEPDIPALEFTFKEIETLRAKLPELPDQKQARFEKEYNLKVKDAGILIRDQEEANFFEEAVRVGKKHKLSPRTIAQVLINKRVDITAMDPAKLVKFLLKETEARISDKEVIKEVVQTAIDNNPQAVGDYQSGKTQVIGVFMGEVMRQTKGKADPQVTREVLQALLQRKS